MPLRRRDHRVEPLPIRHAHPTEVAGGVPPDDEVGQDRLVDRRRVLIRRGPRRDQTLARVGRHDEEVSRSAGNSVLLKLPM